MKKYLCLFFVLYLLILPNFTYAKKNSEDDHPIVCDGFLMGGSKSGKWIEPKELGLNIRGGEVYKLYSLFKYIGEGTGSQVTLSEPGEVELIDIKLSTIQKEPYIAISGDWNALPRIPKVQSNSIDVYKKIVAEVLKSNGLSNVPINIVKSYRIDLDGDGMEEVLLKAEYMPQLEPTCKKGTYSFILLRKIINGKVENILLEKGFYAKDTTFEQGCPFSYDISFFSDLNGDGLMEVILGWKYYEGLGYNVYEIKNNQVKTVLSNGMGA